MLEIISDNIEYEIDDSFSSVNGSSYKGEITTTYDKLSRLFGKPTVSTGDPYEKVNTEWVISGKVFYIDQWGEKDYEYVNATVYNWKTGYTPTEEYGWHIGGKSWDAVELIEQILEGSVEPEYNAND